MLGPCLTAVFLASAPGGLRLSRRGVDSGHPEPAHDPPRICNRKNWKETGWNVMYSGARFGADGTNSNPRALDHLGRSGAAATDGPHAPSSHRGGPRPTIVLLCVADDTQTVSLGGAKGWKIRCRTAVCSLRWFVCYFYARLQQHTIMGCVQSSKVQSEGPPEGVEKVRTSAGWGG